MVFILSLPFKANDPIDGSPPDSPVPGILQTRTLEWATISFSNAWKWKVKVKSLSRVQLLATPWTAAYQAPRSMGFSRQEYWSGAPLPSLFRVTVLFKSHAYIYKYLPWISHGESKIKYSILSILSSLSESIQNSIQFLYVSKKKIFPLHLKCIYLRRYVSICIY